MNDSIPNGKIIVGVDRTRQSLDAARFAMREAYRTKQSLVLIHGYLVGAVAYQWHVTDLEQFGHDAHAMLALARDVLHEEFGDAIEIDIKALPQQANIALIDASKDATLAVVGRRDDSWAEHLLTGSVSSSLAAQASCPVVVVPSADGDPARTDGSHVVVAVDAQVSADDALGFAFESASVRRSSLRVLHVVPTGESWIPPKQQERAIAEALARWVNKYPNVPVDTRVAEGDVAAVCAEASTSASLLVVARPHTKHVGGWTRSVARDVLRAAKAPVAVVPRSVTVDANPRSSS